MKTKVNLKPGTRTILFISAHPDDAEIRGCGFAAFCSSIGDRVVIASVTDGSSGHMEMSPMDLASRRLLESRKSASIIGAESLCLGVPDGFLEPNLHWRTEMIRMIRNIAPDVIITNRLNDYHPDHRYTAELVQDSSYMLMVPNVVKDTPALRYNPIVLYWGDSFTFPKEFNPNIVVSIDDFIDKKLAMMAAHESQMYEWLPYIDGEFEKVPPKDDEKGRHDWIRYMYDKRFTHRISNIYKSLLVDRYGQEKGNQIIESEAFEISEYGYIPNEEELKTLFEGI